MVTSREDPDMTSTFPEPLPDEAKLIVQKSVGIGTD